MADLKIVPIDLSALEDKNKNQELLESSSWGSVKISRKDGIIENLVIVSANYSILKNDRFVIVDTACTVTLPNVNKGKQMTVKHTAATGTVTIDGGDYNIDGAATLDMTTQYDNTNLLFNGIEWSKI